MKYKVVYNAKYGGYILSNLAEELLVQRGHVNPYDLPRHHPDLVAVVDLLKEKANGESWDAAKLQIAEVEGSYIIQEYDGMETVVEPKHMNWIDPEKY